MFSSVRRSGDDRTAPGGPDGGGAGADVLRRVPAEVAVVCGVVEGLGDLDFGGLDGEESLEVVLALEEVQRRLDAAKAKALRVADVSDATWELHGLRTKRWKTRTCGLPAATVGRDLRVASTLAHFPGFAEALAAARLSSDHVLAVASVCNSRVLAALVAVEETLVEYALGCQYAEFVTYLQALVELIDEDGPEPDHADRDTARVASDGAGNLRLTLDLCGDSAVTAERIIADELERQYRQAARECDVAGVEVPELPVLRARAVCEVLRRGAKANPSTPKPAVEAIVTVSADSHGCLTGVHSIDGGHLDSLTAAILVCDAHLQPVVVDSAGTPLNVGNSTRFFTSAQRRAMAIRDGGCIFPGCDRPISQCDAHHFLAWSCAGATDLANGGLLCRRHHRLVHGSNPWSIRTVDAGELPEELCELHRARAAMARMEPAGRVIVWQTPRDGQLLAQNAFDHRGPAPPRRQPAA